MTIQGFLTRLIWLCMAPLLLLAVYLAAAHVETVQARREREATNLARNVAIAIDSQLKAHIAALRLLAASPLIDDPARWSDLHQQARGLRESFGGHVILADVSMQMLFNTRAPFGVALPKLPPKRGQPAVATALETGQPAVGNRVLGPVANEPLIAVAVPVVREDAPRYLLLGILETRQLQRWLDDIALPPERVLTLLDGNGEVLARRSPAGFQGDPVGAPANGRFVAQSAVAPWSVVLEIPPAAYRAPMITAAATLLAAILVATLVGVAGGRLASRGLARSIAALADPSAPSPASRLAIVEIDAVRARLADAEAARSAAESARRESEARQAHILRAMPIVLYTAEPAGDYAATWVSENVDAVAGYPSARFVEDPAFWASNIHADDIDRVVAAFARIAEEGTIEVEYRWRCGDGSYRWFNDRATLIRSEDGSPREIIGSWLDVTERKRTEQKVREQLEELQRWYRAMLDREDRIRALKHEVNELLSSQGQPARYASRESA